MMNKYLYTLIVASVVPFITARAQIIDVDEDSLIDIHTIEELYNVRFNLSGTSYKTSLTDIGNTTGCPGGTCIGYELMDDLDFDKNQNGSTWTKNQNGT